MTRLAMLAEDWRQRLAQAGLGSPLVLLGDRPPSEVAGGVWEALTKPGLGTRERWRWQLDGPTGEVLYVKRYRRPPLVDQLDRLRRQSPRHSRAWWEYRQSCELTRQYVPVTRAVGMAEQMRAGLELRSVLLLEGAPGEALDRLWLRLQSQNAPLTWGLARHDLVRRLARFVSAFHQTGLCHRDLYLCHIFADLDPAGTRPPRFTLIDLARTHRPRLRRTRWLIKDLSQLDCSARQVGASRADRLRFLLAYLGLERGTSRVRWYVRRIVGKSDRILRRIARKAVLI